MNLKGILTPPEIGPLGPTAGAMANVGARSRAAAPKPSPGGDSESTRHASNRPCTSTMQSISASPLM
jgi:hypothetical protein